MNDASSKVFFMSFAALPYAALPDDNSTITAISADSDTIVVGTSAGVILRLAPAGLSGKMPPVWPISHMARTS